MRERRLGIIASIAVHSCLIPLLITVSICLNKLPGKLVEVDFTLEKNQLMQLPTGGPKKQTITKIGPAHGGRTALKKMEYHSPSARENTVALPREERVSPPPEPTTVTASDAQGETVIHGTAATSPESFSGYGQRGSGGGSDSGQGTGQGSGAGLIKGGRDYNYIREAVMKNIRYPGEALRLGIEGKVFISFIVLENGTTSEIRVVSGSGYRVLDESAKEAVAMTRIRKKVPYRVVVHLPVTYKIQG